MSAVLVDQVVTPGRSHLRLVVDNDRPRPRADGRPHPRADGRPHPLVLTSRGRLVARVLAAALSVVLALVVGVLAGLALRVPDGGATSVVTVGPGDSLWSIAAAVAAPQDDVREVMERIAILNALERDVLQPGQQLQVPAS